MKHHLYRLFFSMQGNKGRGVAHGFKWIVLWAKNIAGKVKKLGAIFEDLNENSTLARAYK
jgi:hypothetical protein